MRSLLSIHRCVIAAAGVAGLAGCNKPARVTSAIADSASVSHFKTFSVTAPVPRASQVAVAGTNHSDHVAGAIIDMDPMLSTSLVGRAMSEDLTYAFTHRG